MAARKQSTKKSGGEIKLTVDKDSTVEFRKIENGFIVTESGTTGKGRNQKWYRKEVFKKTIPGYLSGGGSTGNNGSGGVKFGGGRK